MAEVFSKKVIKSIGIEPNEYHHYHIKKYDAYHNFI